MHALVGFLADPIKASRASTYLAQIGATEAAPEIERLLSASQPYIRVAAVAALGKLRARDAAGSVEHLARGDQNQAVRSFALVALAEILGPDARPTIRSAVADDPDWRTRRAAALALGLVGDREDLNILSSAAAEEPRWRRRRYHQARRAIRRRARRPAG